MSSTSLSRSTLRENPKSVPSSSTSSAMPAAVGKASARAGGGGAATVRKASVAEVYVNNAENIQPSAAIAPTSTSTRSSKRVAMTAASTAAVSASAPPPPPSTSLGSKSSGPPATKATRVTRATERAATSASISAAKVAPLHAAALASTGTQNSTKKAVPPPAAPPPTTTMATTTAAATRGGSVRARRVTATAAASIEVNTAAASTLPSSTAKKNVVNAAVTASTSVPVSVTTDSEETIEATATAAISSSIASPATTASSSASASSSGFFPASPLSTVEGAPRSPLADITRVALATSSDGAVQAVDERSSDGAAQAVDEGIAAMSTASLRPSPQKRDFSTSGSSGILAAVAKPSALSSLMKDTASFSESKRISLSSSISASASSRRSIAAASASSASSSSSSVPTAVAQHAYTPHRASIGSGQSIADRIRASIAQAAEKGAAKRATADASSSLYAANANTSFSSSTSSTTTAAAAMLTPASAANSIPIATPASNAASSSLSSSMSSSSISRILASSIGRSSRQSISSSTGGGGRTGSGSTPAILGDRFSTSAMGFSSTGSMVTSNESIRRVLSSSQSSASIAHSSTAAAAAAAATSESSGMSGASTAVKASRILVSPTFSRRLFSVLNLATDLAAGGASSEAISHMQELKGDAAVEAKAVFWICWARIEKLRGNDDIAIALLEEGALACSSFAGEKRLIVEAFTTLGLERSTFTVASSTVATAAVATIAHDVTIHTSSFSSSSSSMATVSAPGEVTYSEAYDYYGDDGRGEGLMMTVTTSQAAAAVGLPVEDVLHAEEIFNPSSATANPLPPKSTIKEGPTSSTPHKKAVVFPFSPKASAAKSPFFSSAAKSPFFSGASSLGKSGSGTTAISSSSSASNIAAGKHMIFKTADIYASEEGSMLSTIQAAALLQSNPRSEVEKRIVPAAVLALKPRSVSYSEIRRKQNSNSSSVDIRAAEGAITSAPVQAAPVSSAFANVIASPRSFSAPHDDDAADSAMGIDDNAGERGGEEEEYVSDSENVLEEALLSARLASSRALSMSAKFKSSNISTLSLTAAWTPSTPAFFGVNESSVVKGSTDDENRRLSGASTASSTRSDASAQSLSKRAQARSSFSPASREKVRLLGGSSLHKPALSIAKRIVANSSTFLHSGGRKGTQHKAREEDAHPFYFDSSSAETSAAASSSSTTPILSPHHQQAPPSLGTSVILHLAKATPGLSERLGSEHYVTPARRSTRLYRDALSRSFSAHAATKFMSSAAKEAFAAASRILESASASAAAAKQPSSVIKTGDLPFPLGTTTAVEGGGGVEVVDASSVTIEALNASFQADDSAEVEVAVGEGAIQLESRTPKKTPIIVAPLNSEKTIKRMKKTPIAPTPATTPRRVDFVVNGGGWMGGEKSASVGLGVEPISSSKGAAMMPPSSSFHLAYGGFTPGGGGESVAAGNTSKTPAPNREQAALLLHSILRHHIKKAAEAAVESGQVEAEYAEATALATISASAQSLGISAKDSMTVKSPTSLIALAEIPSASIQDAGFSYVPNATLPNVKFDAAGRLVPT